MMGLTGIPTCGIVYTMTKGRNSTVIFVRIDDKVVAQLKAKAKQQGLNMNQLMNRAAREIIRLHNKRSRDILGSPGVEL